jgi:dihydroneopterin triphosphate diphosphatase
MALLTQAPTAGVPVYKIPQSVLVVMYTPAWDVLLIERADAPGFWQSVTGSKDHIDEAWAETARREVAEETGIDCCAPGCTLTEWGLENIYDIYPAWRHRYADGVVFNTERVFGLALPDRCTVRLSPREHVASAWLPWRTAAQQCRSASNAEAILHLPAWAHD